MYDCNVLYSIPVQHVITVYWCQYCTVFTYYVLYVITVYWCQYCTVCHYWLLMSVLHSIYVLSNAPQYTCRYRLLSLLSTDVSTVQYLHNKTLQCLRNNEESKVMYWVSFTIDDSVKREWDVLHMGINWHGQQTTNDGRRQHTLNLSYYLTLHNRVTIIIQTNNCHFEVRRNDIYIIICSAARRNTVGFSWIEQKKVTRPKSHRYSNPWECRVTYDSIIDPLSHVWPQSNMEFRFLKMKNIP